MNLGARDGLADDPLQFLLREPRHVEFALAVEMDPECPRGDNRGRCEKPMVSLGTFIYSFVDCPQICRRHMILMIYIM